MPGHQQKPFEHGNGCFFLADRCVNAAEISGIERHHTAHCAPDPIGSREDRGPKYLRESIGDTVRERAVGMSRSLLKIHSTFRALQGQIMSKLCVYHGGCTDGVAAAWAVWKAFPDTVFHAGVYQKEPPYEEIEQADETILVDFSYKRPILERICEKSKKVLILDHHKTAREDLLPLLESGAVAGEFDMDRCGALMAWDWFHSAAKRPILLNVIDAQDRWLPDRNAELIMALRSYPHCPSDDSKIGWTQLMHQWDWLMSAKGLEKLHSDGRAIHRYYRQRVDETKLHAAPMVIGKFSAVPVVNAPYYLASDVAGELAQFASDGIAACWWQNTDKTVTFSLRSRGEVDVGILAAEFGGGGHPGAAGFKVKFDEFIKMNAPET